MDTKNNAEQVLNRMIVGAWPTQAIYVAAEIAVADLLASSPQTADQLAEKLGVNGKALYRLLRALASIDLFSEDEAGRFSLTPLGYLLTSDAPGSKRSLARMAGAEIYRSWGNLVSSVKTGQPAFDEVFGRSFFHYMKDSPDRWRIYDEAMTGIHDSETIPVLDAYDFGSFGTVVDVGGGNGEAIRAILARHRELRGVLFDLPSVVERARERLSSGAAVDHLRFVGGDFFDSVPANADLYLLRHVIHDWDDEAAVSILRNCRDAMGSEGRVLVVESVIPAGNGPSFGKWLDLMMLVVGGRERTKKEYEDLFVQAGLELARIIPTSHEVSIMEGVRSTRSQ